jgi:hypothetical protein
MSVAMSEADLLDHVLPGHSSRYSAHGTPQCHLNARSQNSFAPSRHMPINASLFRAPSEALAINDYTPQAPRGNDHELPPHGPLLAPDAPVLKLLEPVFHIHFFRLELLNFPLQELDECPHRSRHFGIQF